MTQEELLRLMGSVDGDYAQRYSHATVSRWESGGTRPTLQRLQVFGRALELSDSETAGLVLLAGLAPDFQTAMEQVGSGGIQVTADDPDSPGSSAGRVSPETAPGSPTPDPLSILRGAVRFAIFRSLGLGACVVAFGLGFSQAGWDNTWMPLMYFSVVTALVLAQGFLLPGHERGLREFIWVSIFVLLTTPFLQFTPLGLDPYNICLITNRYMSPAPYMLGLLVNVALASGAGLLFHLLWEWQYSSRRAASSAIRRAAWVILPPIGVVYTVIVIISNISVSIQLAILMPVLAAAFVIMLVLRDPQTVLSERDRRFLLSSIVAVGTVSSALGIVAVVAIYVSPEVPMVLPDHNLLHSWEINFSMMGYSREEALDRLNLGYMWHAMCVFVYMFFVIGGNVLAAIFRGGNGNAGSNATDAAGQMAGGGGA